MAVAHRSVVAGLLAFLLSLATARLSETLVIATTSSNNPPFSLLCSTHYKCSDQFQKLVSVQSVTVDVNRPKVRAVQCPLSDRSSIGSQAEDFLNGCARNGDPEDKLTLKSGCLAEASGSVQIVYTCEAAAVTATTPINDVTGDSIAGNSTQQQGESSSQTTVAATAAAVVLILTACSVAGMVLVCWRSGLFCFAARKTPAALPPPAGGARIFSTEQQPVGRLHYACTQLVQQEQQHVQQPTESHQRPLVGAKVPSPPAVLRYFSLTEQEDHCYEALPDVQDSPLPENDPQVIYDVPAVSFVHELPSHFLQARDSACSDAASTLPQEADTNFYFTVEPPAANGTGGVHPHSP